MRLTRDQQGMLDGEAGPATQVAMEIIVALAKIYDAEDLVPVSSCQVSGVSYENIGDAGLEFLESLKRGGGKARVPSTLNPCGLDLEDWERLGFDAGFHARQARVLDAYTAVGIEPTCSCIPYEIGNCPAPGDHVAWSESSAVSYANSVLGAMTNREGGPSALASALTGVTGRYGLHLPVHRVPTVAVHVSVPVRSYLEFGQLGLVLGREVGQGIPYIHGLDPMVATPDKLRQFGAAMAASGAVALYHIHGVTPGYATCDPAGLDTVEVTTLENNTSHGGDAVPVDLVFVGCPHLTRKQAMDLLDDLRGKTLATRLWLALPRRTKQALVKEGVMEGLDPNIQLVADTCLVVCPLGSLNVHTVMTDSGKAWFYLNHKHGVHVVHADTASCVEAAVRGVIHGGGSP